MRSRTCTLVVSLALLVASFACGATEDTPAPVASTISGDELADRIAKGDAPIVLDVRSESEFARGHIPGAVNIPHSALSERLGELAAGPQAEIVVHCENGRRAASAEAVLRAAGYTRVRDLTGHMSAWRAGDFPIE